MTSAAGVLSERDRPRDRFGALVLAASILVVVLPIALVAVDQVRVGWAPVGDDAVIFTRTYDVLSDDPPLVGQFTQASTTEAAYSPGPLGYQLLALPAHVLPARAMPLVVGALSSVSFAATLLLVRRRGGSGLVAATALGLVFVQQSLDVVTFVDIWNPYLAMAPFVLFVAVGWSVAAGDRWLLPVAAFLASLVAQLHLTYVAPGLGVVAVALVGGWAPELRAAWRRRRPVPTGAAADDGVDVRVAPAPTPLPVPARWRAAAGSPWAPLAMAALVAALCWAAPVYQQLTGDPGNLSAIVESNGGDREQFGGRLANLAFVDTYGVIPSFLVESPERRLFYPAAQTDGLGTQLVTLGVVAALVGLAAWGVRRRDRGLAAGAAIALALMPGVWWIVAVFPVDKALAGGYSFRWFIPAGMLAWVVVGWGGGRVASLVAGWRVPVRAGAAAMALVLLAGVVVGVRAAREPYDDEVAIESLFAAANHLGPALDDATVAGGRYRMSPSGVFRFSLETALASRLRRTGREPVLGDDVVKFWGDRYRPVGERCDGVILLLAPGEDAARGRVLATTTVVALDAPIEVRLVLADDTPAGTC